jgi:hypothetical protein
MKLATLVASLLVIASAGSARADDLNPPGGPVHVDDAPAPAVLTNNPPPARMRVDPQQRRAQRQAIRQLLLQQFDRNGDGKLGPVERRQAIRALNRLARRLAIQEMRRERKAERLRGVIRRYDMNGDGNVDRSEMPPGMAKRLQKLDRNGDGWVDDADLP